MRESGKVRYQLKITNFEVELMFRNLISDWFYEDFTPYSDFKKALLLGELQYMNRFMNQVSMEMFSSFDAGTKPSDAAQPERFHSVKAITKGLTEPNSSACFYHGFVLGLIVDLAERYHVRSNRESGFGRYDVIMEPKNNQDDAIVMEFKVYNPDQEKGLEETVEHALEQIQEKKYDTELISQGISAERIRHYGFGFEGKSF